MRSSDYRWGCSLKGVAIVCATVWTVISVDANSSAEYLQQAMMELQQLNVLPGYKYPAAYSPTQEQRTPPQQQRQQYLPEVQPVRRAGLQNNAFGDPPDVERIVLTRDDLADMYRTALARGTAMSVSTLKDVLSPDKKPPRVKGSHLEFALGEGQDHRHRRPMYRYYFFPLESFAGGLPRDHVYESVPTATNHEVQTDPKESQKEVTNPLFLAISSFVGMALLFMTGVLFLPKIGKLTGFDGRFLHDDLLRLTGAVFDAVENRGRRRGLSLVRQNRRVLNQTRVPYRNNRARRGPRRNS